MFQKWIEKLKRAFFAFTNKLRIGKTADVFDAVAYMEKMRALPWASSIASGELNTFSGAFGVVADGQELKKRSSTQIDAVLNVIYSKYLPDAVHTLDYGDDELGPALRVAYLMPMDDQRCFNFVICGSAIGFYKQGSNMVDNEGVLYAIPSEPSTAISVRNAFQSLKEEISRGDSSAPWVQDCIKTFTAEKFSKWLDFQIAGAEACIPNFIGKPTKTELVVGASLEGEGAVVAPAEQSTDGSSKRTRRARLGAEHHVLSASLLTHADIEPPKVSPRDAFYASYDRMAPIYG